MLFDPVSFTLGCAGGVVGLLIVGLLAAVINMYSQRAVLIPHVHGRRGFWTHG